jgi:16S rRNA (uracil1498-N3)-methyltransferase
VWKDSKFQIPNHKFQIPDSKSQSTMIPFFYIAEYNGQPEVTLGEDASRHIVQVLRMRKGDLVNLTDGKGNFMNGMITDDHKKYCAVAVVSARFQEKSKRKVSIAISLLKNTSRFEWFLEKATEIGVDEIIPIICERTEKEKFRFDRLSGICTSAMLQSQQVWLPVMHHPVAFGDWITHKYEGYDKLIAHCLVEEARNELARLSMKDNRLICIGPEGDFTDDEIQQAIHLSFVPVSLGESRLRTETAGVVAATLLRMTTE